MWFRYNRDHTHSCKEHSDCTNDYQGRLTHEHIHTHIYIVNTRKTSIGILDSIVNNQLSYSDWDWLSNEASTQIINVVPTLSNRVVDPSSSAYCSIALRALLLVTPSTHPINQSINERTIEPSKQRSTQPTIQYEFQALNHVDNE